MYTIKLPIIRVERNRRVHPVSSATLIQSHNGSTHSPQRTLNTINKECNMSMKLHLEINFSFFNLAHRILLA